MKVPFIASVGERHRLLHPFRCRAGNQETD